MEKEHKNIPCLGYLDTFNILPCELHLSSFAKMSGLATCCFWLQILICDFAEGTLRRQYATLHGCVCAFDLGHVHEAWTAPYHHATWKRQFRNRLEGRSQMREVHQEKTEEYILRIQVADMPVDLLRWGLWLHMLSCCHPPELTL